MKKKFKSACYRFINADGITVVIAAIIIFCGICLGIQQGKESPEIVDWTIFGAIIIAMLLETGTKLIREPVLNYFEDDVKLTTDYKQLVKRYKSDVISCKNQTASAENIKKAAHMGRSITATEKFPVTCEYKLGSQPIEIRDSEEMYELPEFVKKHFDELFGAHVTSEIYNQLNIRVSRWGNEKDGFVIETSRTTYYYSLVTNRAMDFKWSNGVTVREQYEFGPFLNPLEKSSLSNHLGMNGFVESKDGQIVFVKRGKNLSIGKGTYGDSVGASLKAKYAINENGRFTSGGLLRGIVNEIEDELKIPGEVLEIKALENMLIAAYRDLVEGGKPQLLFYAKSRWTKDEIEANFFKKNEKKNNKNSVVEDGNKLLWIPKNELSEMCIFSDGMIHHGQFYPMMPSASASVVMLIEWLQERPEEQ